MILSRLTCIYLCTRQLDQKVSKVRENEILFIYELEGIVVGEVASGQDLDDQNEGKQGGGVDEETTCSGDHLKESMGSVENRTFFGNTTSPSRADSDPISPPDPSPSSMKRPPLPPVPLLPLAMQAYSFGYNKRGSSSIIVSFIHRALDRTDTYFLNPFRCGIRVYVWLS